LLLARIVCIPHAHCTGGDALEAVTFIFKELPHGAASQVRAGRGGEGPQIVRVFIALIALHPIFLIISSDPPTLHSDRQ
jgi:hypothetical protein